MIYFMEGVFLTTLDGGDSSENSHLRMTELCMTELFDLCLEDFADR